MTQTPRIKVPSYLEKLPNGLFKIKFTFWEPTPKQKMIEELVALQRLLVGRSFPTSRLVLYEHNW